MKAGCRLLFVLQVLFLGCAMVVLFVAEVYLPVGASVIIMFLMMPAGLLLLEAVFPSVLPRLAIVLYCLPFSATLGYLVIPGYVWWESENVTPLIQDALTTRQMLMIGNIGLAGLLLGIGLVTVIRSSHEADDDTPQTGRTLGLSLFLCLILASVCLSWLSAPSKTIFEAKYASEGTEDYASKQLNFNASYLVSYLLLVLLYIDSERDLRSVRRRMKLLVVFGAAVFIVIFFQILRGDRESFGLVASLMALYLTGPHVRRHRQSFSQIVTRRAFKLSFPAIAVIVSFMALGAARSLLSPETRHHFSPGTLIQSGFSQNTWTAVLLTNLSLADQYRSGKMEYLYGQTYLDYTISLPPGIITRLFGVERPLESNRGPAQWFQGISLGGIHIALVPFRNFGAAGLLVILATFGIALATLERHRNASLAWRLMYGAVIASSFFWFWYGDMNAIRAVIIAGLLAGSYRTWLALVPVLSSVPIINCPEESPR